MNNMEQIKELLTKLQEEIADIKKGLSLDDEVLDELNMDIKINSIKAGMNTLAILGKMENNNLKEAFNACVRDHGEAIEKCSEHNAFIDKEFIREFDIHYISAILTMAGLLILSNDVQNRSDNITFLRSKVREALELMHKI